MKTRKLRITVPANASISSDIDAIQDPFILAHRLINLEAQHELRHFDNKLRMSALHNVCVRGQLLGLRNNATIRDTLPLSLRVTFDIGNAIHYFLQNCEGYLGKNRLGWWRCSACRHKTFGRKPEYNCMSCNALCNAMTYEEHALKLPTDIPLSGHVDGFVEVAPGDIRIIDFKTINGEEFEALKAPKPEHIIQVTGYMHYIQFDETLPISVNSQRGLILYVSKKHSGRSLPFKIFHVHKENMFLDMIENKLQEFKHGLDDPQYLPAPLNSCVASSFKSGACRSCNSYSYCVEAFNNGKK